MRLRELRKSAGLSYEKLAHKLDVSYATIRNWELGVSEPSATHIKTMAGIFGVSTDYLLGIPAEAELDEEARVYGDT